MKALAVFLFLLLFAVAPPAFTALIEGRVIAGDNPVAGMRIVAYPSLDPRGEPLAESPPSGTDGSFQLEVPAGYVVLYGRDPAGEFFAFSGRSPVRAVADKAIWVGLQRVPVAPTKLKPYADDYSAGLQGQVLAAGQPLSGAVVYLYLDANEELKGQGYRQSLPTGPDGYFAFDNLPQSDYFLVARKRLSGARLGPIREGDLFGIHPANPLRLQAGEVQQVSFSLVPKLPGSGAEVPNRVSSIRLQGQVVDHAGQPVAGAYVFAYRDRVIGHARPEALSPLTADDGRFTIDFAAPGRYYLGARQYYGDSPAPGELFGMYDESADHGLQVEKGIPEIRIEVTPIELF